MNLIFFKTLRTTVWPPCKYCVHIAQDHNEAPPHCSGGRYLDGTSIWLQCTCPGYISRYD